MSWMEQFTKFIKLNHHVKLNATKNLEPWINILTKELDEGQHPAVQKKNILETKT